MTSTDAWPQILERLKALIRPNDRFAVLPRPDSFRAQSQLQSNVNGLPYFEPDERWPINLHTRRPLDFVFQIVNSANLLLPQGIHVLQFFYDWDARPSHSRFEGWLIKTYTDTNSCVPIDLPRPNLRPACQISFWRSHALPSWDCLEKYDPQAYQLCLRIAPQQPWDAYDEAKRQLIGQQEVGSMLSAYPQWVQGDATPNFGQFSPKLLVQFDSQAQAGIEWGNRGSLFIFYHPLRLTELSFVVQSAW